MHPQQKSFVASVTFCLTAALVSIVHLQATGPQPVKIPMSHVLISKPKLVGVRTQVIYGSQVLADHIKWVDHSSPRYEGFRHYDPDTMFRPGMAKRGNMPRDVDDATYTAGNNRGAELACLITDPSLAGARGTSAYNSSSQLQDWGWESPSGQRQANASMAGDAAPTLVGNNEGIEWNFKQTGSHTGDPAQYPPTNAEYNVIYWPSSHVIVVNEAKSPQYQVNQSATSRGEDWSTANDKVPDLSRLSDVIWISWKSLTTDAERSSITWVLRRAVADQITKDMLAHVLKLNFPNDNPAGQAPNGWNNKRVITPDMQGFAALLDTPAVRAVAWMLIQHLPTAGLNIVSVTAYTEGSGGSPNVLIGIGKGQ